MSPESLNKNMNFQDAFIHLKDGELCIVTTNDGEQEAKWSATNKCFYYLGAAASTVCHFEDIEEWRPASILF